MDRNTTTQGNPWLGLRTYTEGEVIYGRSEEIRVIAQMVLRTRQVVLYGRSGIGKSSILNAGVFPAVRSHGVLPVGIRLEHNSPVSYTEQIKQAVDREYAALVAQGKASVTELVEGSADETLWEYFHRMERRDADGNPLEPLLVFDQFEEIFTLETRRGPREEFFGQLADLINNVMPERLPTRSDAHADAAPGNAAPDCGGLDLGLESLSASVTRYRTDDACRLIITLREDFLSYLERSTADIPALRNNRYCLQPINEEQAADIIMQPRRGLVAPEVAHLIISRVSGENDFRLDGVPEIQVDSAILSLYLSRLYDKMQAEGQERISAALVEAYSDNIIEDFYADAISGLPEESVCWLEDTLVNEDGRRDNRDRLTVMREGRLSDGMIRHLADDVKLLRVFSYGGDLRVEYIHDVLCPVVVKRRIRRNEERRIAEVSAAAERERRRARKNIMIVSLVAIAVAAVAVGAYLRHQYLNVWEVTAAYAGYETCDGWPVGIGPELSGEETARTPRYYLLSKRGHATPHFTSVSVAGSNEVNTDEPVHTPFEIAQGAGVNALTAEVERIDFSPSATGEVDYLAFTGRDGRLLFTAKRYQADNGENYAFSSPDGSPLAIAESGAVRASLSLDSLGHVSSIAWYDAQGVRVRPGSDDYGYLKHVSPDRSTVSLTALNEFSMPAARRVNMVVRRYGPKGLLETSLFRLPALEAEPEAAAGTDGVHRTVADAGGKSCYDTAGRLVRQETYTRDARGNITEVTASADGVEFTAERSSFDAKGRETDHVELDERGDTMMVRRRAYDDSGELALYELSNSYGRLEYFRRSVQPGLVRTERAGADGEYVMETDSTLPDGTHVLCFFDAAGRPVNRSADGVDLHRRVVRRLADGTIETERYVVDADGAVRPMQGEGMAFRLQEKFDADGNNVSLREFDTAGRVLCSMMFFYENGRMTARAVMGVDGTPVRCPDWEMEHFGYYKLYFNNDYNGQYTNTAAVNEAGKESALYWADEDLYIRIAYKNLKGCKVAVDGLRDSYRDSRPYYDIVSVANRYMQQVVYEDEACNYGEAEYLHLLDRDNRLYAAGLRDGDVVEASALRPGSGRIAYRRYADGRYASGEVKLDAPLTPADLEHVHIHRMKMTAEDALLLE